MGFTLRFWVWSQEQLDRLDIALSSVELGQVDEAVCAGAASASLAVNTEGRPPIKGVELQGLAASDIEEIKAIAAGENMETHVYRNRHLLRIEPQAIFFELCTGNAFTVVESGFLS